MTKYFRTDFSVVKYYYTLLVLYHILKNYLIIKISLFTTINWIIINYHIENLWKLIVIYFKRL